MCEMALRCGGCDARMGCPDGRRRRRATTRMQMRIALDRILAECGTSHGLPSNMPANPTRKFALQLHLSRVELSREQQNREHIQKIRCPRRRSLTKRPVPADLMPYR